MKKEKKINKRNNLVNMSRLLLVKIRVVKDTIEMDGERYEVEGK